MEQNIGQILARRAHRDPHLEALVDVASDLRLSYAQLDERANTMANALLDLGMRKGDRLGVLLMNGVEFIETFFGAAKVGLV
ncbi:MAG: class I adenylate-forming enzyme family protein, partial [Myxococcota bacterium]